MTEQNSGAQPPLPEKPAAPQPAAGTAASQPAQSYRKLLIAGWLLFVFAGIMAFVPFAGFIMAMLLLLVVVVLAIIIMTRKGTVAGVVLLIAAIVIGIPFSFIASAIGTAAGMLGGAAVTMTAVGSMDTSSSGYGSSSASAPKDETPQQILDNHAGEYAILYARGRFMHEIWLRVQNNFNNAEAEKLIAGVRDELKTNGYEAHARLRNQTFTAWVTSACGLHVDYNGALKMEGSAWNPYGNYQEQDGMFEAHIALMLDECKRKSPPPLVLPNLGTEKGRAQFCELWKARDQEAFRLHHKNGPVRSERRVLARARDYVNTLMNQKPVPPMDEIETTALKNLKNDYAVQEVLRRYPGTDLQKAVYAVTRKAPATATPKSAPAAPAPAKITPSSAPAASTSTGASTTSAAGTNATPASTGPIKIAPSSAPVTPGASASEGTGSSTPSSGGVPKIAPSSQ